MKIRAVSVGISLLGQLQCPDRSSWRSENEGVSFSVCLFLLSVTCRSLSRCLSISLHHFLSLSLSVYLPTCGLDLFSEDVRGGSGFLSIVVTHLTFIVDEKQYNNGFSFDGPTLWARSALCLGLIFLLSG